MPYYDYYYGSKTQFLVLASELTAAGMLPGNIITIGFDVTSVASSFAQNNFYIAMKLSTATALSTTWETGLTTVISPSISFSPVANSVNVHTLTTPFYWNGTSNIVLEVCHNNSNYNTNGASTSVKYINTSFNATHYYYADATTVCASPSTGYTATTRPNIFFGVDVPPNNTGITAITHPTPGDSLFCSGINEVKVNLHNFGNNVVNGVNINWKVNNVLQTPVNYTTMLDMENTVGGPDAEVSLGTLDFPYNIAQNIVAWTSMPNGVTDPRPANDTAKGTIKSTLLGLSNVEITPGDTVICSGTSVMFDAGEYPKNPIYIWSDATLTKTINISDAGIYWVKVQNTDGCYDYDTITVTMHPNPLVNSIAMIDNADGSYTFNVIGAQNISTYEWDFGDGQTQEGTGIPGQIIHQYVNAGQYTVKLTLSNDCGDIETIKPISTKGIPTGISNVSALQQEISIFPNPSKSVVTISNNAKIKMNTVGVFNIVGQKVFEISKINGEKYEMNISSLAVGIYNVVIDTEAGRVVKKLEVIK